MLQPATKTKTVFVCDICSYETYVFCDDSPCNTAKTLDTVDFKVGDEIVLYLPVFYDDRYKELKMTLYGFMGMHYSQPGERIYPDWPTTCYGDLPVHTLVLSFGQKICLDSHGRIKKIVAWKPGDRSYSMLRMTLQDFLLWKEGDRAKLETAGLLPKISLWERIKMLSLRMAYKWYGFIQKQMISLGHH